MNDCYPSRLPQHARCGSPLETAIAVARESQNRLTSSVSRIRATALETDGSLCFDKRSEIVEIPEIGMLS